MDDSNESIVNGAEIYPTGFNRAQLGAAISPRRQELIILPTEKCNLRCTYCYEDFELGKMSESTQRSIELFLRHRVPDLNRLSLLWFGGEPLVAKDIVCRITKYAKVLCDENGVQLDGSMTTNGYLLNYDLLCELLSYGIDFFQITFDGWGEAHDTHRRRADGKGTFNRIWNNLCAMKASPKRFEVMVRVHVRRGNLESVRQFLEKFANEFHNDRRFRLDYQHLRDLGGERGKSIEDPVSFEELKTLKLDLDKYYQSVVNNLQNQSTTSDVREDDLRKNLVNIESESAGSRRSSDRPLDEAYICYATHPNSLLIRSNGRIGKCTVALSDDRNDLGYIDAKGILHLNNKKLLPWMRGLRTLNAGEVGCPLNGMPEFKLSSPRPRKGIIFLNQQKGQNM